MNSNLPFVSIGLPVFNEEKYLKLALDSLLAQDYQNFEIIISDNASTDRTSKICEEYAKSDKRIKYLLNESNIGGIQNFNKVFENSSGKYFFWASGHDIRGVTFLSKCVNLLENNPNVILCSSDALWIDSYNKIGENLTNAIDTIGLNQIDRFKKTIQNRGYNEQIYGLIRKDILNKTGLYQKIIGPDLVLINELSLIGEFAHIEEPLLFIRKLLDYGSWEDYCKKHLKESVSIKFAFKMCLLLLLENFKIINTHVKGTKNKISAGLFVFTFLFGTNFDLFLILLKLSIKRK